MVGHLVLAQAIQVRILVSQHMWVVYIIKSLTKKWYYVGSTNRLIKRIDEHNRGRVQATKAYKPLQLVYTKELQTEYEARTYEKKLKQCRIEKEAIIREIEKNL